MSLVLRGVTATSIILIQFPYFPNLLTQAIRKFLHQNRPTFALHAWKLSSNQLEIKKFHRMLQILSNQEEHLLRKPMMQYGSYTPIGFIERRLIRSRPLLLSELISLYIFFSEKKCQISTIKGYRSMISNTFKFKSGNRIGSNPVLSELIRSFELQHPVQRSLSPKWDLSWVLICLQKAPYEPLYKTSKLHISMKTAFLLALATAKRCSEIHALAMDSNHVRFSQSAGSVSLILQTGFLAKNKLPSI